MQYGPEDPRRGVLPGVDEGDDFKVQNIHQTPQSHWYSSIAEAYRAFTEAGEVRAVHLLVAGSVPPPVCCTRSLAFMPNVLQVISSKRWEITVLAVFFSRFRRHSWLCTTQVWVKIGGGAAARPDVAAHGAELLALAPAMYTEPKFPNDYEPGFEIVLQHCGTLRRLANFVCRYEDLHASLNKTVNTTASPGHNCYPHRADGVGTYTVRSASQAWTVLNINRLTNH